MLISYQVRGCTNCGAVSSTLQSIDIALSKYSNSLYQNYTYATKRECDIEKMHDLLIYKMMLKRLLINSKFYYPFTSQQIISQIKNII